MNVHAIAMGVGCGATLAVAGPCIKNPASKPNQELAILNPHLREHNPGQGDLLKPFRLPTSQPPNTIDDLRSNPDLGKALLGQSRTHSLSTGPQTSGSNLGKPMFSSSSALAPGLHIDPKKGTNWIEALRAIKVSSNSSAASPKSSGSSFGMANTELAQEGSLSSLGVTNSGGLLTKTIPVLPRNSAFPLTVPWDSRNLPHGSGIAPLPQSRLPWVDNETASKDPSWLPPGLRPAINKWDLLLDQSVIGRSILLSASSGSHSTFGRFFSDSSDSPSAWRWPSRYFVCYSLP